jgi:hypothetical protein
MEESAEGSDALESVETTELVSALASVEITLSEPKVSPTVGILGEKLKLHSSLLKPDVTAPTKLEISDINVECYTKRRGMDAKDYAVYSIIVTMSNGMVLSTIEFNVIHVFSSTVHIL